ncbi:hypothetical protein HELRODRAFT_175668 [Helobdella robusta]|uniref:Tyrosine-protein kinase n=1 Tax=Helobdella robusta TaxID=6412 RepID=T1F9H9_HELRO|nr:hypothetical protein HELRODRAFT_175668 [Helobdella robusta]ESO00685.1 hypothetical protein HELRODRAFT_175668 [Helobdella robusta]
MGSTELKLDFMSKRSQMKGRIKTDSYKSRWFKLTPTALFYYDGKITTGIGKVKGQIDLKTIKVIEKVDGEGLGNKQNVFQIVYNDPNKFESVYTLYIVAAHAKQQEDWILALREAAKMENAQFSPIYHLGVWMYKQGKWSCCGNFNFRNKGCLPSFCATSKNVAREEAQRQSSRDTENLKVLALFEYQSKSKEELSLKKGEELEILSSNLNDDWVKAKNEDGWYFKDISRAQAETILESNGQEGCFMVRDSSRQGIYTLSLYFKPDKKSDGEVKHYHIKQSGNDYFLTEKHKFLTLPELVYYHKHNCAAHTVNIDPKELELREKLGSGQFGTVHRAIYKETTEVAVKTMKEGSMSELDFLEEAKIMAKLHHPNLVQLYGVSANQRPIMIITEYMRHGSLYSYLRRTKHHLMKKQDQLIDICLQICKAMAYLEKNSIIHRDLASRNCLVGDNYVVKVCDFGLARFVLDDEYTSSEGAKFPVRWASVEVLTHQFFSSKSDVWAYGVLMWEIFTCGDLPYLGVENLDVYDHVSKYGNRLEKPDKCSDEIYQIMQKTWQEVS